MPATPFTPLRWPFTLFSEARSVRNDTAMLVGLCGVGALEAAELNAFHEDYGFLPTARAGHWARVARDIARREGHSEMDAAMRPAA